MSLYIFIPQQINYLILELTKIFYAYSIMVIFNWILQYYSLYNVKVFSEISILEQLRLLCKINEGSTLIKIFIIPIIIITILTNLWVTIFGNIVAPIITTQINSLNISVSSNVNRSRDVFSGLWDIDKAIPLLCSYGNLPCSTNSSDIAHILVMDDVEVVSTDLYLGSNNFVKTSKKITTNIGLLTNSPNMYNNADMTWGKTVLNETGHLLFWGNFTEKLVGKTFVSPINQYATQIYQSSITLNGTYVDNSPSLGIISERSSTMMQARGITITKSNVIDVNLGHEIAYSVTTHSLKEYNVYGAHLKDMLLDNITTFNENCTNYANSAIQGLWINSQSILDIVYDQSSVIIKVCSFYNNWNSPGYYEAEWKINFTQVPIFPINPRLRIANGLLKFSKYNFLEDSYVPDNMGNIWDGYLVYYDSEPIVRTQTGSTNKAHEIFKSLNNEPLNFVGKGFSNFILEWYEPTKKIILTRITMGSVAILNERYLIYLILAFFSVILAITISYTKLNSFYNNSFSSMVIVTVNNEFIKFPERYDFSLKNYAIMIGRKKIITKDFNDEKLEDILKEN